MSGSSGATSRFPVRSITTRVTNERISASLGAFASTIVVVAEAESRSSVVRAASASRISASARLAHAGGKGRTFRANVFQSNALTATTAEGARRTIAASAASPCSGVNAPTPARSTRASTSGSRAAMPTPVHAPNCAETASTPSRRRATASASIAAFAAAYPTCPADPSNAATDEKVTRANVGFAPAASTRASSRRARFVFGAVVARTDPARWRASDASARTPPASVRFATPLGGKSGDESRRFDRRRIASFAAAASSLVVASHRRSEKTPPSFDVGNAARRDRPTRPRRHRRASGDVSAMETARRRPSAPAPPAITVVAAGRGGSEIKRSDGIRAWEKAAFSSSTRRRANRGIARSVERRRTRARTESPSDDDVRGVSDDDVRGVSSFAPSLFARRSNVGRLGSSRALASAASSTRSTATVRSAASTAASRGTPSSASFKTTDAPSTASRF